LPPPPRGPLLRAGARFPPELFADGAELRLGCERGAEVLGPEERGAEVRGADVRGADERVEPFDERREPADFWEL
jgi:hypothetical protein